MGIWRTLHTPEVMTLVEAAEEQAADLNTISCSEEIRDILTGNEV